MRNLTRYGFANILGILFILAAVVVFFVQAHSAGRAEIDRHANCPMNRCLFE